jgi:hypothetical protein
MLRYLSLVLVLIFCSPGSSLLAQTRNATLHGTVTDPTGAVIPGFGPRTGGEEGSPGAGEGRGRSGGFGGGLGAQGLSGSQSGPVRLGASSSHKFSLTFSAYGQNIFNHENLGTPNGTLSSPLFGKSQSLAGGFFGASTAGNRSIFFATEFHF